MKYSTGPDTSKILSERELFDIMMEISRRIEDMKDRYPHLKDFRASEEVRSPTSLYYRHNVSCEPAPEKYADEEIDGPGRKRHLQQQEIPTYSKKDGIEIRISLTGFDDYRKSTRVWVPDLWIGNHAVEITINGAGTKEIEELRGKVKEIVLLKSEEIK